MRWWWWSAAVIAAAGCGEGLLVAEEPLAPGTELKVVAWTDGLDRGAALRTADEASVIPLSAALDAGRTLRVMVFSFTRAELDAAVPGARGLTTAELTAGVVPGFDGATRVPGAAPVLEAIVDGDSTGAAVYVSVPRPSWDAAVAMREKPAIGLTVADAVACRVVEGVDAIELPNGFAPTALAAVDAERAFAVGTTGTIAFQLIELSPGGSRAITVDRAAGAPTTSFAWDGRDRSLWVRNTRSQIVRLAPNGELMMFPEPPETSVSTLSAGSDGTVIAIAGPYNAEGGLDTMILAPDRSAWVTVPNFRGLPSRGSIRAHAMNRFIGDLNCHTLAWEFDRDAGAWNWGTERASDSDCRLFPRDRAIDATQFLWLGFHGTLRVGVDDAPGVWPEHAHAIPITQGNVWPRALAAMGERRFAVAGERGQVEVWIGDRWCVPDPVTPDVHLTLGSGAADVAWFVGTDEAAGPLGPVRALRITLAR